MKNKQLLLAIATATLFTGCAAGTADRVEDRYDRYENRQDKLRGRSVY